MDIFGNLETGLCALSKYYLSHVLISLSAQGILTFVCVLFQILNAAYHVEVTFHSGSSVTRMLWEQIKQVGLA